MLGEVCIQYVELLLRSVAGRRHGRTRAHVTKYHSATVNG